VALRVTANRLLGVALVVIALAGGTGIGVSWYQSRYGVGHKDQRLPVSTTIPSVLQDQSPTPSAIATPSSAAAKKHPVTPLIATDRPGIPVRIVARDQTGHVELDTSRIVPHPLASGNHVWVPESDPGIVAWMNQDAAPGNNSGTVIYTSHRDYAGVSGALAPMVNALPGWKIAVYLQDGRIQHLLVVAPALNVLKAELESSTTDPAKYFGQYGRYGIKSHPLSSRTLFVTCGGNFDNATGNYQSNIFTYALADPAYPF
jgi:hypothetical protein